MIEASLDAATATRLAFSLSGAGVFLLGLEIFFANRVFALFGVIAFLGGIAVSFKGGGLEVGFLLLLALSTVISLGFLVTLAFFPKTPLARQFLQRTAARAAAESASESEESEQSE